MTTPLLDRTTDDDLVELALAGDSGIARCLTDRQLAAARRIGRERGLTGSVLSALLGGRRYRHPCSSRS